MHLRHFGDSYDIVKQALLRWLADLGPWVAHPMFTEVEREGSRAFSDFLGVPLVSCDALTADVDRTAYFRTCHQHGHLFLDPDTGLKVGPAGRNPKYLYGDELLALAQARPSFLTITFDQSLSRGRSPRDQVEEKLRVLALPGFAYVSHAAFTLVGCDPLLVGRARDALLARSRLPASRVVSTPLGLNASVAVL